MDNARIRFGPQVVLTTCLMMLGTSAYASSFCDGLRFLAQQGHATVMLPGGAVDQLGDCRRTLSLGGGRDVHCSWSFGYRSKAAKDAFENVTEAMTQCLGPDAVQSTDRQVNHPDAYDLRLFKVGTQDFAVSLKDKGALQQTLIFLRVPLAGKP